MSELSFEQMLEESLKTIRTGEVVTGKVIDVKEDEIVLNIGYKSDGIIPKNEYTNEPGVDPVSYTHLDVYKRQTWTISAAFSRSLTGSIRRRP